MTIEARFGSLGAWLPRSIPVDQLSALAPVLEDLGYGTLWVSGGREPGVLDTVAELMDVTRAMTIAPGVVNIWAETPQSVTAAWNSIESRHPGRLMVGLGVSHGPLVNQAGLGTYTQPLERTRDFLDELDALADALPQSRRVLGALGPKMLELARERTFGSHPYLVTPENTAAARSVLGDAFVGPELGVVLEPDLARGRQIAREALSRYFALPNYTRNWLRAGFGPDDLLEGGSDRLIDAVVAIGDVDTVAQRVQEHREAGADHVAVQVLHPLDDMAGAFRALAPLR
jgi:probable F420-dependent oxidoreductase